MSSKCQRCARAGRECVYTVHSKTRRRKRTDTRVKELEEKVKNLSVLLEQGRSGTGQVSTDISKRPSNEPDEGFEEEYDEMSDDENENEINPSEDYDGKAAFDTSHTESHAVKGTLRKSPAGRSTSSPEPRSQPGYTITDFNDGGSDLLDGIKPDVVDRGLLGMKEATTLFDRYVTVLIPQYPGVVFPLGATAAQVRENQPILCVDSQPCGLPLLIVSKAFWLSLRQQLIQQTLCST